MATVCRRTGGLTALLLSCSLLLPEPGLAQSRMAAVSVTRDEIEPCLSFDPDGAQVECVDTGALFEGIGRAAVPAGAIPTVMLAAAATLQGAPTAPLFESVGAQAVLQDLVTLGGAAPARVTFAIRVTGTLLQQSAPDATATLQVDVLGQGQVWNTDQSIDVTIPVTVDLAPGVPQEVTILASARASMTRPSDQSPGGAASIGGPGGVSIRVESVRIADASGAPLPAATLASALGYTYPVLGGPLEQGLVSVGPATLSIGLQSPGDWTPLDVRAEVYLGSALVASGERHCLADLTAPPHRLKEVAVPLGTSAAPAASGDALSLRLLARPGTNPDGSPCAPSRKGRPRSDDPSLYYDAGPWPARLPLEIAGEPPLELLLLSDGPRCRPRWPSPGGAGPAPDPVPPHGGGSCRDAGRLDLNGTGAWTEVDTWTTTLP